MSDAVVMTVSERLKVAELLSQRGVNMAHFYGMLIGQKGPARRLGSKGSGIKAVVSSWEGSVGVELYEKDGVDYACVSLHPWEGKGIRKLLYNGPVSGKETVE